MSQAEGKAEVLAETRGLDHARTVTDGIQIHLLGGWPSSRSGSQRFDDKPRYILSRLIKHHQIVFSYNTTTILNY